eukprot:SAG11_NODE_3107_length_2684_cov_2.457640_2_plen_56_part_00
MRNRAHNVDFIWKTALFIKAVIKSEIRNAVPAVRTVDIMLADPGTDFVAGEFVSC